MDYITQVTAIGPMVSEFLDQNMIIVFNDNAPAALAEIAVLHTIKEFSQDIKVGDVVIFGENEYVVTAVGSEANHTLKTSGHCTFSFDGADTAKIPGQIELSGGSIPDVKVGDRFEIIFT